MPTRDYDAFEKWVDSVLFGTTYTREGNTMTVKTPISPFEIRSILSNRKKNAFTVVWKDGTTTVVHCQPGDEWDDEKALAMCFTKKALGNKGNFNDKFNDALDNKMKVIPGSAGIIAEKECECDNTCEVCECKMTVAAVGENRNGSYLTEEAIANASTEVPEKACEWKGKRYGKISGESLAAEHADPEAKTEAEKFIEEIDALKKKKNAFGIDKQAVEELQKTALKATSSFKEMVEELANMSAPKTKKTPLYRVFIRISGKSHHDSDFTSIDALRERVHEIAEEYYGRKPYYYRTWLGDNGRMIMDFGHYTKFIEVEGITPSEYAKN